LASEDDLIYPVASTDGKWIAFINRTRERRLGLINLSTQTSKALDGVKFEGITDILWINPSELLYVVAGERQDSLYRMDIRTGKSPLIFSESEIRRPMTLAADTVVAIPFVNKEGQHRICGFDLSSTKVVFSTPNDGDYLEATWDDSKSKVAYVHHDVDENSLVLQGNSSIMKQWGQ
jgi:hypothetical protein